MQENKVQKIKCRCCGKRFRVANVCPYCGFEVIIVLGNHHAQADADAKKWSEEHSNQVLQAVGVVYNRPATWKGEELVPGEKDYLKLADLSELSEEFLWNSSVEFASFGSEDEVSLKVYFEYLDGSRCEKNVPIKLPQVRGVTWNAAVRVTEKEDGVEFAVGIPERFTKTETVNFSVS